MYLSKKPSSINASLLGFMALIASIIFLWGIPIDVFAQPALPNILPDGVNAKEKNPGDLMIQVGQWVIGIVLWIGVAYLAVKVVWEAIGDIKDAKNGDTKWIAAGKSIAGGVFFFLLVLAMALWITNQFL